MIKIKDYLDNLIIKLLTSTNNFYAVKRKLESLNIKLDKQTLLNRIKRL